LSETIAGGRYSVVRRLAAGGMGEVLLAEFGGDAELSAGLLVVKRILPLAPGVDAGESQVRMLLEEGRLGLRLQHENLVQTFRIDQDGSTPILVIELLAGRSMAQVLGQAKKQQQPVPVDVALAVLRGACAGLHFAHTLKATDGSFLGLVHRDISPANIFVTFDGGVKVIDFGVAKSEDSELKTATGILKGKLGYMSPEQATGSAKLTAQADIWSLGVFFWELLLAERLFNLPNPAATLMQVSTREIPRPRTMRADIPPAVDDLVMKMLTRPLEHRFANCTEVIRAIDAISQQPADVAGFLAERFPADAATGQSEAARASRLLRRTPSARFVPPAEPTIDDDDPATSILPASLREQLLRASYNDDDDDAATVRVDPAVLDAVRGGPRPTWSVAEADNTIDDLGAAASDEDDRTRRLPPDVIAAVRGGGVRPTMQPTAAPLNEALRVPLPSFGPAVHSAPALAAPPVAPRPRPPTVVPPAAPPPAPAPRPLLALVGTAAGAVALVAGLAAAHLTPAPAPQQFFAWTDPAGFDVVVAQMSHAPAGMQVRRVLPGDAVLLRSGEREPKLVDASEFQSRLETAGVWARASLPTSPQQVAAALLPLLLVLLAGGLLGLAAPALVLRAPRPRLAAQLVMVACVAGFAVAALEGGALGWAGRRAFQEQPALPWR
jgi:serine/threonine protein kinase